MQDHHPIDDFFGQPRPEGWIAALALMSCSLNRLDTQSMDLIYRRAGMRQDDRREFRQALLDAGIINERFDYGGWYDRSIVNFCGGVRPRLWQRLPRERIVWALDLLRRQLHRDFLFYPVAEDCMGLHPQDFEIFARAFARIDLTEDDKKALPEFFEVRYAVFAARCEFAFWKAEAAYVIEALSPYGQRALARGFLNDEFDQGNEEFVRTFFAYLRPHLSRTELALLADYELFYFDFLKNGRIDRCVKQAGVDSVSGNSLKAVAALQTGNVSAAARFMRKAAKIAGHDAGGLLPGVVEFLFAVTHYADRQNPISRKALHKQADSVSSSGPVCCAVLDALLSARENTEQPDAYFRKIDRADPYPIKGMMLRDFYFTVLTRLFGSQVSSTSLEQIREQSAGLLTCMPILEPYLMRAFDPDYPLEAVCAEKFGIKPLVTPEAEKPVWEAFLEKMLGDPEAEGGSGDPRKERICYVVDVKRRSFVIKLQKRRASGEWSRGRSLTPEAFCRPENQRGERDRQVARTMRDRGCVFSWHDEIDDAHVLAELAGCEDVVDYMGKRVQIVRTPLSIAFEKDKDGNYVMRTNVKSKYWRDVPTPDNEKIVAAVPAGPGKITVTEIKPEELAFMRDFDKVGALPSEAGEMLYRVIERSSRMLPVSNEIINEVEQSRRVAGDPKLVCRIAPVADEFEACVTVVPVEGFSLACEPGKGLAEVLARKGAECVRVTRNLAAEAQNFEQFTASLAELDECRFADTVWRLDMQGCLRFLEVTQASECVRAVQWPKGEPLVLHRKAADFGDLNLALSSAGSWFALLGELEVSEGVRMTVTELLRAVREAKGDFIALKSNEYVKLTKDLKRRLEVIESLASDEKTPKVSRFQAQALQELKEEGLRLEVDRGFEEAVARFDSAGRIRPTVPAALQAELRDYQVAGFKWMMRLAAWGAGAVLADDMGLGKTVQTIAVLAARARQGAALVVTPSSVLLNWKEELERFAPSLNVMVLNLEEDRAQALKSAGPGMLVLATYGVMTAEIEALAQYEWATVVLDEAHNIKNRQTKGFKAAVRLKGAARILLTGTPLQNHLAELWTLFEFANPGLLGTYDRFVEKFVMPIEKNGSRERQRTLKRVIAPFILRRTKTDVLNELPEKTEITVTVELTEVERALYEQLRREAEDSLSSGEINPVQALAELTKLRLAACSSELVDASLKFESAKTKALLALVRELMASNHRALVFSQFTSHLAVIGRALQKEGIEYLYLDGSMTPAARTKLVEKFRDGATPLFLISLKAGGTGLNLTAADYVIHMDPWWNPAVEDQASDRAYRMGQDRPVTIYRLIAENTVEEKILKLHDTKKSLADALLEGTDVVKRLGKKELLELLALAQ